MPAKTATFTDYWPHFIVMWVLALLSLTWVWPRFVLVVLLTFDALFVAHMKWGKS